MISSQMHPVSGAFEFVWWTTLDHSQKKLNRKYLEIVMTDRYSKFSRPVPTFIDDFVTHFDFFMNNWINVYGIPTNVLTKTKRQSICTFFETLCVFYVRNIWQLGVPPADKQANRKSQEVDNQSNSALWAWISKRYGHVLAVLHMCL